MTPTRPSILLIGLRGSGKSTLGRQLADALAAPFADLDDDILARFSGATIADVWREHGEAAFRHTESEALVDRLRHSGAVLALGGGAPTAPGATDAIGAAQHAGEARVIYLHAPPDVLRRRFPSTDPSRPSLTGADPRHEIERVYNDRNGRYTALADAIVDATRAPEAVLDCLVSVVRPWWDAQAASE